MAAAEAELERCVPHRFRNQMPDSLPSKHTPSLLRIEQCELRKYDICLNQLGETMRTEEWAIAAKLLVNARDHLAAVGWQAAPASGSVLGCVCTALEATFRKSDATLAGFDHARAALLKVTGNQHSNESRGGSSDSVPYWGIDLVRWNDTPNRTAEEVLGAFDRAVAYCQTQEG